MTLSSYKVESTHYRGKARDSSSPKVEPEQIEPEKIVSMRGLTPSQTSYGRGPARFHQIGNDVVTVTASGNQFRTLKENFLKYGPITEFDDYGIKPWKAAGEDVKPAMFSLIKTMPNISYITGATPLGMHFTDSRDTSVNLQTTPRLMEAVAPNDLGVYVSKQANQYSTLRSMTFTEANWLNPIAVSWINMLGEEGYALSKGKTKGIIGLGIENGSFLAKYNPGLDFLVTETNYHDNISRSMPSDLRNDPDAIEADKQSSILHEIAHALGVPGTIKGEHFQGELKRRFYTRLANEARGTKKERIYRALADEGRAYAEMFSLKNALLGRIPQGNRESHALYHRLLEKIASEVDALELEGEEAAAYTKARINNTYGALADGSHENSKTSSNYRKSSAKSKAFSKESNSKDLEARLTEDSSREARSEKTEASEAEAEEAPESKE